MKMAEEIAPKKQIATQQEMVEARVPLGYRDQCAHLLIPLNKCRVKEYYLPWKCENERHTYEKCEYELFMERVRKMEKIKKEAKLQNKKPLQLLAEQANAS